MQNEWPIISVVLMLKLENNRRNPKFGCAQFQHLQAIVSQHQDLCSQLQCLEAEIWAFFDANPHLIKKMSTKCVTLEGLKVLSCPGVAFARPQVVPDLPVPVERTGPAPGRSGGGGGGGGAGTGYDHQQIDP